MHGTFDNVEQFTDVVVAQTGLQTEIPGPHLEPLRRLGLTACLQSDPQDFVDGLLKRLARFAHLRFQLGAHIFVEGQGGPHIMMLHCRHHDVKCRPGRRHVWEWRLAVESLGADGPQIRPAGA